jgi:hypothetical protein
VLNNPLRYTDPTGHRAACEDYSICKVERSFSKLSATDSWKKVIKDKFGVTMSDGGGKNWDASNLALVHSSLEIINKVLNGKLRSLVGGATFRRREYELDPGTCRNLNCTYDAVTSGTTVTFNTTGGDAIHQMNIFHEFGHLLDNSPGMVNGFSGELGQQSFHNTDGTYLFGGSGTGWINSSLTLSSANVSDPNFGTAQAIQHPSTDPVEQWGDMFANYVAGNINTNYRPGQMMQGMVTVLLFHQGVYP